MPETETLLMSSPAWLGALLFGLGVFGLVLFILVLHKAFLRGKKITLFSYIVFALSLVALISATFVFGFDLKIKDLFEEYFSAGNLIGKLLYTLISALLIFAAGSIIQRVLQRASDDLSTRHKIRRTVFWGTTIIFLLSLIFIWAGIFEGIGAFLGIFAAGLALSLQETLLCMVGWLFIVIRRPFDIGDRIEVEETIGDIIDIRVFQTHLLEVGNWVDGDQSTGRIVMIPNSSVFRKKVSNYTKGFPFIWNELRTIITFDSDWHRAREIILAQAQEESEKIEQEVRKHIKKMQREYAIRFEYFSPVVYTKIEDNGVALTLRYLTPVRRRRGTTSKICDGILEAFYQVDNINLAYPTWTIHNIHKSPETE
ncbi:MAG: mechanosensitive ion channel family protein [Planctomycetes bacterium]|nr:mechanosensitive ion channel family protein [Planctomycetota bacterium]